jgi:hypothetical protein
VRHCVYCGKGKKQRTDIGKYSFENRKNRLCNTLPAEALAIFPSKLHILRKRVRKVIINEERCRVSETW